MEAAAFRRNAWRWKCGLSEQKEQKESLPSLKEIQRSQWNPKFEILRLNRMVLGFFRYGFITGNKSKYDNINSAIRRLAKYQETGNSEFLVDAANLCMIEFTQENHKDFHFESVDDGEHTKEIE